MLFGLFGPKKKRDVVFEKFNTELKRIGMKIDSIDANGLLQISKDGFTFKVSLNNVRRNYLRDEDETHIIELANTLMNYGIDIPVWEEVKHQIFISLFPSEFDFQDFIHQKVTEDFHKVFVYNDEGKLVWITKANLKNWNISEDEFEKQVEVNINTALKNPSLEIDVIENRKLGWLQTEEEILKTGLLFSKNFKDKVEKDLGWPVYALLPVRDFCYIFSENDWMFFCDRMGGVVVKEYKESGYPITTEVLKFSDKGVEVVGKYPVN